MCFVTQNGGTFSYHGIQVVLCLRRAPGLYFVMTHEQSSLMWLLGNIIFRVFHYSEDWAWHPGRMFLEGSTLPSSSAPTPADIPGKAGMSWRNRCLVGYFWESVCLASKNLIGKTLTSVGIIASSVDRDADLTGSGLQMSPLTSCQTERVSKLQQISCRLTSRMFPETQCSSFISESTLSEKLCGD